jgi:hypothetical protein
VIRTALIIGCVALVLGALGYWMFAPGSSSALDRNLTEVVDPTAVQSMVQLSHPKVAVSENYVGDKIKLIRGSVKNTSDKAIRLVDIRMQFSDYTGKLIQEGVHQAFEPKQRPLEPGGERPFEIAFDKLPRTWNYQPPAMQVVKVAY